MSKNEIAVSTSSQVQTGLDHQNGLEIKKNLTMYEEYEKELRKLYLDHPDRKQIFSYDLVETIWFHIYENYDVAVGDEEVEEIINSLIEDHRIYEIVYDISEKLATKRGWEMK